MNGDLQNGLLSTIYGAAVDGRRWSDVPVALARATASQQCNLEIFDPYAAVATRLAPLCDPESRQTFREHWHRHFSLRGRTDRFALGQVFTIDEVVPDMEVFLKSAFVNEWWKPQGVGQSTLMSNVVRDGRATAVISVFKKRGDPVFSASQRASFAFAVGHLIRAMEIHRRLRLAEVPASAAVTATIPPDFLIADDNARILKASDKMLLRLEQAGLLAHDTLQTRIRSPDLAIERLLRQATGRIGGGTVQGGNVDHRTPDGLPLRITVIPCVERDDAADSKWLAIDRPAALVHVSRPGERNREHVDRLVKAHGLTLAEAKVAVEIARGDGRAAVAARLGIREATVRSHLSAIFDKLDIHRQAQLARIVASC